MHVHRSITRRTFLVAGSAAGLVAATRRLALAQAPAVKRGKADRVVFGIGLAPIPPVRRAREKGIAAKPGIKAEYKISKRLCGWRP